MDGVDSHAKLPLLIRADICFQRTGEFVAIVALKDGLSTLSVAVRKKCKRGWKTRLCEHCETRRPSCGHSSLCARFSCVHHGVWINQLSVPERTTGLPLARVHYVDLVRANQNRPCQNQPKLKSLQSVIFISRTLTNEILSSMKTDHVSLFRQKDIRYARGCDGRRLTGDTKARSSLLNKQSANLPLIWGEYLLR